MKIKVNTLASKIFNLRIQKSFDLKQFMQIKTFTLQINKLNVILTNKDQDKDIKKNKLLYKKPRNKGVPPKNLLVRIVK